LIKERDKYKTHRDDLACIIGSKVNKSDISESSIHTEDEHSDQDIEMIEITNKGKHNENKK